MSQILLFIFGSLIIFIKTEILSGISLVNIEYSYNNENEKVFELTVSEGEEFALRFYNNISLGFRWFFLNKNILILNDYIQFMNRTTEPKNYGRQLLGAGGYFYLFYKALKRTNQPINLYFTWKRDLMGEETLMNIIVKITVCKIVFNAKCINNVKLLQNLDLSSPKFYNLEFREKNVIEYIYLTVKDDISYDFYYLYYEKGDDLHIEISYEQNLNSSKEISNTYPIFQKSDKILLSITNNEYNLLINFYVLKLGNIYDSDILYEGEILAFGIDSSQKEIIKNIKTINKGKNLPFSIFIKLGVNKDFGNKLTVFGENLTYNGFSYKLNSNIDAITILSSIEETQLIPIIIKMCVFNYNIIEISENNLFDK